MNALSSYRPALRIFFAVILLALLAPTVTAQTKAGRPATPAKPTDDLDLLLKADAPVGTLFRLVDAADPKQPLEPRLFWRRIPAFASASTTPVRVSVGGDDVIAPKQITEGGLTELNYTYPIEGRRKLEPGRYVISPGDIPLVLDAGRFKSDHPALLIAGDEVQIRCAPVRFDGVNEAGAPVPVNVEVAYGKTALLREKAAFSPLVVWLPVGVRYLSTLGNFNLSAQGKLENVSPEPGVTVTAEGLRLLVKSAAASNSAAPAEGGPWLVSHRGRAVFTPAEEPVFTALVARGFAAGEAKIMVALGQGKDARNVQVGTLALPAVAQTAYDSRAFTLRTASLPIGDHQLWIETAGGASAKLPISVVSWEKRSSFFTETTSQCTGQWPANDAGLQLLADAGVQMVASSGFHSVLDTAMPTLAPAGAGPAELGLKRAENDLLLERLLRHGLRSVDLTPMRGQVMYFESLSYHHSYQPTVDRMVRKMQTYTQQTADYPSAWGVNYSWFPVLGGYAEGGVPTDAHVADRNRVLGENLAQAGFVALTKEERAFQAANKFSSEPAERAKALELQRRGVAYWKAQQDFGWGRHNKLYNDAVREVRPDTVCLLLENAGHDALKRTRSIFGDMDASFYGGYTDYGDWPMSAAFTTDWARGNFPGQPVWLTTCWGTSPEGMMKSLLHSFSRGANGGGVPMQEDSGMALLARRAKGLAFVTQFGAIATKGTPDQRFAILSTASEQVFAKDQAQYVYHALYMHLTRLGCAPIIVDDGVAVEKGIPAAVKVLFLARQQQPLEPELADAIAAFQKRGGKVVTTADCLTEVPGAIKLDQPVKQIWELGGFTAESHAKMRSEFEEHFRGPLAAALAQTGVAPATTTDPDRGDRDLSRRRAGALRGRDRRLERQTLEHLRTHARAVRFARGDRLDGARSGEADDAAGDDERRAHGGRGRSGHRARDGAGALSQRAGRDHHPGGTGGRGGGDRQRESRGGGSVGPRTDSAPDGIARSCGAGSNHALPRGGRRSALPSRRARTGGRMAIDRPGATQRCDFHRATNGAAGCADRGRTPRGDSAAGGPCGERSARVRLRAPVG